MKRACMAIFAAAVALGAAIPATAGASVLEIGATKSPLVAPVCPASVSASNCTIVLTQVTAYETIRDGVAYPTRVKKAGRIVAFTLGVSRLDSNTAKAKADVHFLDSTYGGTSQA